MNTVDFTPFEELAIGHAMKTHTVFNGYNETLDKGKHSLDFAGHPSPSDLFDQHMTSLADLMDLIFNDPFEAGSKGIVLRVVASAKYMATYAATFEEYTRNGLPEGLLGDAEELEDEDDEDEDEGEEDEDE